jgi:hypothetical protein
MPSTKRPAAQRGEAQGARAPGSGGFDLQYSMRQSKPALPAQAPTEQRLTAKQEAFAQAISKGMKQAHAYALAYPDKTGKRKPEREWEGASRLMADRKIAARVNQLTAALEADAWHDAAKIRSFAIQQLLDVAANGTPGARQAASKTLLELGEIKAFDRPTEAQKSANPEDLERALKEKLTRLLGQPIDIVGQPDKHQLSNTNDGQEGETE